MDSLSALIYGKEIIINDLIDDGIMPKRHHRKRRINKKWLKRYGYKPRLSKTAWVLEDKIFMSSYAFKKLQEALKNEQEN